MAPMRATPGDPRHQRGRDLFRSGLLHWCVCQGSSKINLSDFCARPSKAQASFSPSCGSGRSPTRPLLGIPWTSWHLACLLAPGTGAESKDGPNIKRFVFVMPEPWHDTQGALSP
jgi:hypothetical protein